MMNRKSRSQRYLVQVCMGHGWGGPHMYMLRIAEEAAKRGYESVIAANPRSQLEARARKAGFKVLTVLPDDRGSFWRKLLGLQRRGSVRAVHLHSIRGLPRGFISLPGNIQMVLTEHSYRFREVLHPLSRMALSRVDSVLATSQAIADVNGRALGVNPERMRILHHGVNLHRFHPDTRRKNRRAARRQFNLREDDLVLVVPTTFRRDKNLFHIIEVTSELRKRVENVQLLLTGNFAKDQEAVEYRRELLSKIEEFGLTNRVHFTGYLERIEDAYAASDVVCVPTEFEAFGLPAVEAMGSGLPVVGSTKGAFPEIVEHGQTGYCLDVNDLDLWVNSLEKLLKDHRLRDSMCEAGRLRAQKVFSLNFHFQQLFDIYEEDRNHKMLLEEASG